MSSFLHWYIWIVAIGTIVALFWLIQATRNVESTGDENETTGHDFDGIEEYNKPLPAWWLYLFWGTMVYGLGYYAYYGLGNWNGLANWTSAGQLAEEQQAHNEEFGALFAKFASMPIEDMTQDAKALQLGRQIFENNCALCHGISAEGGYGFPNLTDSASLYGNTPAAIKTSIEVGRKGMMPAWESIIGGEKVDQVTQYVLSLSGQSDNEVAVAAGQTVYAQSCMGCHGPEGKGNLFIGAPDLTDADWLYAGQKDSLTQSIRTSIAEGRAGVMPAWKERLGEAKVQLLTGYVYSLSQ